MNATAHTSPTTVECLGAFICDVSAGSADSRLACSEFLNANTVEQSIKAYDAFVSSLRLCTFEEPIFCQLALCMLECVFPFLNSNKAKKYPQPVLKSHNALQRLLVDVHGAAIVNSIQMSAENSRDLLVLVTSQNKLLKHELLLPLIGHGLGAVFIRILQDVVAALPACIEKNDAMMGKVFFSFISDTLSTIIPLCDERPSIVLKDLEQCVYNALLTGTTAGKDILMQCGYVLILQREDNTNLVSDLLTSTEYDEHCSMVLLRHAATLLPLPRVAPHLSAILRHINDHMTAAPLNAVGSHICWMGLYTLEVITRRLVRSYTALPSKHEDYTEVTSSFFQAIQTQMTILMYANKSVVSSSANILKSTLQATSVFLSLTAGEEVALDRVFTTAQLKQLFTSLFETGAFSRAQAEVLLVLMSSQLNLFVMFGDTQYDILVQKLVSMSLESISNLPIRCLVELFLQDKIRLDQGIFQQRLVTHLLPVLLRGRLEDNKDASLFANIKNLVCPDITKILSHRSVLDTLSSEEAAIVFLHCLRLDSQLYTDFSDIVEYCKMDRIVSVQEQVRALLWDLASSGEFLSTIKSTSSTRVLMLQLLLSTVVQMDSSGEIFNSDIVCAMERCFLTFTRVYTKGGAEEDIQDIACFLQCVFSMAFYSVMRASTDGATLFLAAKLLLALVCTPGISSCFQKRVNTLNFNDNDIARYHFNPTRVLGVKQVFEAFSACCDHGYRPMQRVVMELIQNKVFSAALQQFCGDQPLEISIIVQNLLNTAISRVNSLVNVKEYTRFTAFFQAGLLLSYQNNDTTLPIEIYQTNSISQLGQNLRMYTNDAYTQCLDSLKTKDLMNFELSFTKLFKWLVLLIAYGHATNTADSVASTALGYCNVVLHAHLASDVSLQMVSLHENDLFDGQNWQQNDVALVDTSACVGTTAWLFQKEVCQLLGTSSTTSSLSSANSLLCTLILSTKHMGVQELAQQSLLELHARSSTKHDAQGQVHKYLSDCVSWLELKSQDTEKLWIRGGSGFANAVHSLQHVSLQYNEEKTVLAVIKQLFDVLALPNAPESWKRLVLTMNVQRMLVRDKVVCRYISSEQLQYFFHFTQNSFSDSNWNVRNSALMAFSACGTRVLELSQHEVRSEDIVSLLPNTIEQVSTTVSNCFVDNPSSATNGDTCMSSPHTLHGVLTKVPVLRSMIENTCTVNTSRHTLVPLLGLISSVQPAEDCMDSEIVDRLFNLLSHSDITVRNLSSIVLYKCTPAINVAAMAQRCVAMCAETTDNNAIHGCLLQLRNLAQFNKVPLYDVLIDPLIVVLTRTDLMAVQYLVASEILVKLYSTTPSSAIMLMLNIASAYSTKPTIQSEFFGTQLNQYMCRVMNELELVGEREIEEQPVVEVDLTMTCINKVQNIKLYHDYFAYVGDLLGGSISVDNDQSPSKKRVKADLSQVEANFIKNVIFVMKSCTEHANLRHSCVRAVMRSKIMLRIRLIEDKDLAKQLWTVVYHALSDENASVRAMVAVNTFEYTFNSRYQYKPLASLYLSVLARECPPDFTEFHPKHVDMISRLQAPNTDKTV